MTIQTSSPLTNEIASLLCLYFHLFLTLYYTRLCAFFSSNNACATSTCAAGVSYTRALSASASSGAFLFAFRFSNFAFALASSAIFRSM